MRKLYGELKSKIDLLAPEKKVKFYTRIILRMLLFGIPFFIILLLLFCEMGLLVSREVKDSLPYMLVVAGGIFTVIIYLFEILSPKRLNKILEDIEKSK